MKKTTLSLEQLKAVAGAKGTIVQKGGVRGGRATSGELCIDLPPDHCVTYIEV